jgi:hypothetical protein
LNSRQGHDGAGEEAAEEKGEGGEEDSVGLEEALMRELEGGFGDDWPGESMGHGDDDEQEESNNWN